MEVMSEVKVFQVKMKCDKCKEGYMVRKDTILTFHPPLYSHICNKCGHASSYRRIYPYMKYVPVDLDNKTGE